MWSITKVADEDFSRVVSIPEAIQSGEKGIAIRGGLRVFKKDAEYLPTAGDVIAVKDGSWEVEANDNGGDVVVKVDGDYVYTKEIGGSGGGSSGVRVARIQSIVVDAFICKL